MAKPIPSKKRPPPPFPKPVFTSRGTSYLHFVPLYIFALRFSLYFSFLFFFHIFAVFLLLFLIFTQNIFDQWGGE
jgi:hypothetical protein